MNFKFFELIKRSFPILKWSKGYNLDLALADLVAGITIGLTLIPQCIAYASLAGLGPEFGLYSSLFGGVIYMAFGGVPELNIAPTALLSLLTFSFTHDVTYNNVQAAILLCFMSGVIELICGFLHLGFLVDFVSTPVVAAFTSAGALTIASSQVKNLLGLNYKAHSFTDVWISVFRNITNIKKWDTILGVCCCITLLLMRKLKDFGTPPLSNPGKSSTIKKVIWFCSVGRNAFVVITCAVIAYLLSSHKLFTLTSTVPQGLPKFSLPVPSGSELRNGTHIGIVPMLQELGVGIFVVPFVAILSNVAIAKAFAKGKMIDATQEMIAVGFCNLFGSFFGSYPVNASFSRAAVSNASGVKTPISGIYTGIIVVLALTFLTPYFSYIPKPTLAAVIICAVIFMVEVSLTKLIWETNKVDLVPFTVTLISCLALEIEIGILIGVAVDLIFVLYGTARPKIIVEEIETDNVTYTKITPTSAILFPSAEYIREKIMANNGKKKIIIDCQRINRIDFTAATCINACISDISKTGCQILFYRPKKTLSKILRKDGARIAESEADLHNFLKGPAAMAENNVEIVVKDANDTPL